MPKFRMRSFLAVCCALALQVPAAAQLVYPVTNTFSSGAGSLANQVNAANGGGGGTVAFDAGSAGTTILLGALGVGGGTTLDATNAGGGVTIAGAALSLNGAVTFANGPLAAPVFTVASAIAGAGSFTKTGAGVVALTGVNSYSGGTILNAGILNVNADAALGSASGGLTFNGGTLQAGTSLVSARTVTLNANGIFDTNGHSSFLTGLLGGTGQLVVADGAGGGMLVLSNTGNTYSGGTLLQGGTLSVVSDASLGSGGLTFNGGTFQTGASLSDGRSILLNALGGIFDTAGTTSTFSGVISGGGTLTKISSGTLILSGVNTYTGGTVINKGVLAVSADANLGDPGGAVMLNGGVLQMLGSFASNRNFVLGASSGTIDTNGYSDTLSGAISGAGGLTKIGAGTLTLGGANTYSGGTFVNAGTLQMGANNVLPLNNNMTIAGGATFDMNGFSQTNAVGNVTNNGLINVGAGQLVMGGTYQGTGTLALTLLPGITNVTSGTMNLTGGTLALKPGSPGVKNGDAFTAISATTVNGSFANVVSPAAVTFLPTYNPGSVVLTASLIPFASLASSPNQAAVGGALESLRAQAQTNPAGAAGGVIGRLYSLNAAQIQAAFDQVGPIALTSMSSLGLAGSSVQSQALGRRMTTLDADDDEEHGAFTSNSINGFSPSPGVLLAAGGVSETDPSDKRLQNKERTGSRWGFFASAVGTSGRLGSINAASGVQPGYGYTNGGLVLGGDYKVAEKAAVGLVAGYLYGRASVDTAQASTVENSSARAGAYATGRAGQLRGDLYVGGALDFFSTDRGINFGGTQNDATARPKGSELNANADFNYDFDTDWGIFSPFAGINEDRLMIRSFSEGGAGALDLNVSPQTDQSLRSSLGLRQSIRTTAEGVSFLSHWSLGWVHEYMNQSRPIDAQFSSGAGSVFAVQTAALPRDGALAGIGAVANSDDTSVSVDYSADIRQHFIENVLSASLRYRF
jgi:autotransporter-associated beta strand protein